MVIKQFTEMRNPDIWDISEDEDVIITRKGRSDQRVLINFKTYESIKKSFSLLTHQMALMSGIDNIAWDSFIDDFNDILANDHFKEVESNYFENIAKEMK